MFAFEPLHAQREVIDLSTKHGDLTPHRLQVNVFRLGGWLVDENADRGALSDPTLAMQKIDGLLRCGASDTVSLGNVIGRGELLAGLEHAATDVGANRFGRLLELRHGRSSGVHATKHTDGRDIPGHLTRMDYWLSGYAGIAWHEAKEGI